MITNHSYAIYTSDVDYSDCMFSVSQSQLLFSVSYYDNFGWLAALSTETVVVCLSVYTIQLGVNVPFTAVHFADFCINVFQIPSPSIDRCLRNV